MSVSSAARSFLLLALLFAGCGRPPQQEVLDRPFASLCEAFEAAAKLTLSLHLTKDPPDYPGLRAKVAPEMARAWGVEAPAGEEAEGRCTDIRAVAQAMGEKGKMPNETLLYQRALAFFVSSLDPHSGYRPPAEAELERQEEENVKIGIGAAFALRLIDLFRPPPFLRVEEIFPKSPAEGKVEAGDRILKVDGTPVDERSLSETLDTLRTPGRPVALEIDRKGEVTVRPAPYRSNPVYGARVETQRGVVGHLRIREFTVGTAKAVAQRIRGLGSIDAILLDLRLNSGGFTDEAVETLDLFLDKGIVASTRGSPSKKIPPPFGTDLNGARRATEAGALTDLPLVALIDARTVSAAELVAGTLAESGRALALGSRTYGKGTGQREITLSARSGLGGRILLTMFRYYLAGGFSPQLHGVRPHVSVPEAEVERLMVQKKARSQPGTVIFREEDYGELAVPASGNPGPRPAEGAVRRLLDEVARRRAAGEFRTECAPEADCPLLLGLRYLDVAIETERHWPLPDLEN